MNLIILNGQTIQFRFNIKKSFYSNQCHTENFEQTKYMIIIRHRKKNREYRKKIQNTEFLMRRIKKTSSEFKELYGKISTWLIQIPKLFPGFTQPDVSTISKPLDS